MDQSAVDHLALTFGNLKGVQRRCAVLVALGFARLQGEASFFQL